MVLGGQELRGKGSVMDSDLVECAAALGREHGRSKAWNVLATEDLFRQIGYEVRAVVTNDECDESLAEQVELCRAYEDAYHQAWRDEVLRMAREQVES